MAEASGVNLTGAWTGVYFYPVDAQWNPDDDMAPTPFKADITDINGHISGTTVEPDLIYGPDNPDIRATLEGHREGLTLVFTKFPDGWQTHTIDYVGDIADDGNSIAGKWIIHGEWSGVFRMQRGAATSVRAETRVMTA